jgi:hypothetical protein
MWRIVLLNASIVCLFSQNLPHLIAESKSIGKLAVNGSLNPDAIPDSTAWEVFLHTMALGTHATAEERRLQRLRVSRAQLDPRDFEALHRVLATFHEKLSVFNARASEARKVGPLEPKWTVELIQLRGKARQEILGALSDDGRTRLNIHVNSLKPNIKIFGMAGK